jgi:cytochrome c-type biogenesis protein CcmH/NrfG
MAAADRGIGPIGLSAHELAFEARQTLHALNRLQRRKIIHPRRRIDARIFAMNKLSMSKIKSKSGVYYAVGIAVFSAVLVVLAVIVELVQRNS